MDAKRINKINGVIGIVGTFVIIGIIAYQTKENHDPIIIAGIASSLIVLSFLVYVFFLKPGKGE